MVLWDLEGIALLGPVAPHEHHRASAGQSCRNRGDGFDGGFAGVDASVFGFRAQEKKGAFSKARVAFSNRTGVFSLVPMR